MSNERATITIPSRDVNMTRRDADTIIDYPSAVVDKTMFGNADAPTPTTKPYVSETEQMLKVMPFLKYKEGVGLVYADGTPFTEKEIEEPFPASFGHTDIADRDTRINAQRGELLNWLSRHSFRNPIYIDGNTSDRIVNPVDADMGLPGVYLGTSTGNIAPRTDTPPPPNVVVPAASYTPPHTLTGEPQMQYIHCGTLPRDRPIVTRGLRDCDGATFAFVTGALKFRLPISELTGPTFRDIKLVANGLTVFDEKDCTPSYLIVVGQDVSIPKGASCELIIQNKGTTGAASDVIVNAMAV